MPPEGTPENLNAEEKGSLDRLQERLYSQRDVPTFTTPALSTHQQQVSPEHSPEAVWTPAAPPKPKKPISWSLLFLGGALGFFLIAGGVSLIFLARGGSSVSSDNIAIVVQGPTSIASGTVVPLVVTIQNHNPAQIINANITLDFPDGTRSSTDVTQPLPRFTDSPGAVPKGGSVSRTASAVFFGNTNQTITVPITLTYHTNDSNAQFIKKQNYTFTITSSPLTITSQAVSSVAAGQPFTIALSVRSNASTALDGIAVVAQYPSGFTPQSVTGKGVDTSNSPLYSLGTLAPGEQRNFSVTGTLSGSNNDQRAFQFTVGTAKSDGTPNLSVAYASQTTAVGLSRPFLAANLTLNNTDADPAVITSGNPVSGMVSWVNTLAGSIRNAKVSVSFSGNALDPSSVSAPNGYYTSSSNTLAFNSQTEPNLASLNPGDAGSGSFTFNTKNASALRALRNPTIQLSIAVSGQTDSGAQTITNTVTRTVQIATDLELASRIVHSSGPFQNSGLQPPVANQPTQYTVLLSVTNTVNSVGGASATMILPSYVTFTGQTSPSDGSITYDDRSRTVTWKVGDVPAGTLGKPLTAAFQISFTPSLSQRTAVATLVGNQTLTGTDRFTNAQVSSVGQALTTETTTDPGYQSSFGTVSN
jgi:hypothetical protein